jgi:UPF0716 protein FxsA
VALLVLVVLFIGLPVAELAVILRVADGIGIPETIVVLLAVSVVGGWLCKREGLGVLRRIQRGLERHELPTRELADGGLILLAGALLVTPGFLTDLLGILLLLPPTRVLFRGALLAALARRTRVTVLGGFGGGSGGRFGGGGRRGPGAPGGSIDTTGNER